MTTNKKIELVCPAGGRDQLIAAINAGADAVYLGYKQFGARAYAENFDFASLKEAVKISHENDVKVYLTLNTLIKDSEMSQLAHFLNEYLSFCRDGIIIQDFGLFKMMKDLFLGVRIHASTQINIHNVESARLLYDLGFSRLVLAREMTLNEIKNISSNTGIEIEVFGHGSQCYSYSGNCYFSSFTGLRSGNRGRCTQPCRMKYSIESLSENIQKDNKNKQQSRILIKDSFILSKSDLSTLDIIPQLVCSGVNALKIEGRMKTAEYVAIITKTYRKYLDLYYSDPESYKVEREDIYKATQVFSRQAKTGYFLKSFPEEIVSLKKSGSIGNFLGRIQRIERKALIIKSALPVREGDIIEVWTNRGNERLTVKRIISLEQKDSKVTLRIETDKESRSGVGDRVFKFFDEELDREAKGLYRAGILADKDFRGKDNKVSKKEFIFSHTENMHKKLSKQEIEDYFNFNYAMPAGKSLNQKKPLKKSSDSYKPCLSVLVYSMNDAQAIIDAGIKNIIVDNFNEVINDKNSLLRLKEFNKTCADRNVDLVIRTPNIIYDDKLELLENNLNDLFTAGINNFSVSNPGIFNSKNFKDINVFLDYPLNIFNANALEFFNSTIKKFTGSKLKNITLSPELNLEEIVKLINHVKCINLKEFDFSVYSYGYFPVMTSRFKLSYFEKDDDKKPGAAGKLEYNYYLVDQKGYQFRMQSDYNENLIFLNSKKICNFFNIQDFIKSNINFFLIDTRTLKTGEILNIIEFYNKAISLASREKILELEKFNTKVAKNKLLSDYTRGHFFREVL